MREILFRGKREDNGEWVYGYYVKLPDAAGSVCFMHVPASNPDEHNTAHYVALETVGQYTGLTDNNGNKIFEGDILKNTLDRSISIVEWSEAHTAFTLKQIGLSNLGVGGTIYGFPRIGHEVYLIIGNIHDNPELIGGDK